MREMLKKIKKKGASAIEAFLTAVIMLAVLALVLLPVFALNSCIANSNLPVWFKFWWFTK